MKSITFKYGAKYIILVSMLLLGCYESILTTTCYPIFVWLKSTGIITVCHFSIWIMNVMDKNIRYPLKQYTIIKILKYILHVAQIVTYFWALMLYYMFYDGELYCSNDQKFYGYILMIINMDILVITALYFFIYNISMCVVLKCTNQTQAQYSIDDMPSP